MSYKFPVYRCESCGVTRDDPPETGSGDEQFPHGGPDGTTDEWKHKTYACRIAYVTDEGRVRMCGGIVKPWAFVDSDSYITMHFED